MKVLVTGVAGFIGSHLAERLIVEGHKVVGVDCFTDYYPRAIKESNIKKLRSESSFDFHDADILEINLETALQNIDVVYHEAAQAGVRASWGANFKIYTENNVRVTQRLLEAAKTARLKKFIYASSSSVYGDAESYPTHEEMKPMPISPYGVTKLAAEHLCYLYNKNFGIPTVSLRYFTVYGPRQRPDMAFHKFIKAILHDEEIPVFGDGNQTRDFTYIDDIIDANISAMNMEATGEVFNIGGGSRITVNDTIAIIERVCERKAKKKYIEKQKGDVIHTAADISKAKKFLGYAPKYDIEKGIANQVDWMRHTLNIS
ncbi:UDP-glucose 4-epimerase [candidate division WOR_3 bacterium SM1_77]|uniref:UDP-glucose 4-epimerase n=1 Tax=candidate division WOR_3 bacterium SM1_77 TaxID=1703778 RepID=A0A0S8JY28_UNCW3|nr:MAG: UDP-glucose 4-epimerase [candidate division WOR_3 bacterium SM1_77]